MEAYCLQGKMLDLCIGVLKKKVGGWRLPRHSSKFLSSNLLLGLFQKYHLEIVQLAVVAQVTVAR